MEGNLSPSPPPSIRPSVPGSSLSTCHRPGLRRSPGLAEPGERSRGLGGRRWGSPALVPGSRRSSDVGDGPRESPRRVRSGPCGRERAGRAGRPEDGPVVGAGRRPWLGWLHVRVGLLLCPSPSRPPLRLCAVFNFRPVPRPRCRRLPLLFERPFLLKTSPSMENA